MRKGGEERDLALRAEGEITYEHIRVSGECIRQIGVPKSLSVA